MEKNGQDTHEKRSIFWYGAIGIGIFGAIVWILLKAVRIIYSVGYGIGLDRALKKYLWAHIAYYHPALEAIAIFILTILLALLLTYIIGLLFSKQIRNETLIKKIFVRLPLFRQGWKFFEDIHDTIHAVKNSPFVVLKDYPAPGFKTLGIITRKQIFDDCGIYLYARPCVFVMYSIFLPNGPIMYPEKEKIEKISTSPSLMIKLMVTYGFQSPDKIKTERDLAYYYTV